MSPQKVYLKLSSVITHELCSTLIFFCLKIDSLFVYSISSSFKTISKKGFIYFSLLLEKLFIVILFKTNIEG